MDRVARLAARERSELFAESAARMGTTPAVVEKDFWVSWVLCCLFADAQLANWLMFKGGTSLSKAYGLIQRFSEDIDLVQIKSKPIRETIERLRIQLGFLDLHQVRQKLNNNTLVFKYDSEKH